MHDRNTMSAGYYIFRNIAWLFMAMILYRTIAFRRLPGWGFVASVALLWWLAIICVAIGVAVTRKKRRTTWNLLATICIPFGIYSLLSSWVALRRVAIVLGFICIVLLVAYFLLVMEGVRFSMRWIKRFVFFALGARIIVALGFLALILVVYIGGIFGRPLLSASRSATVPNAERWGVIVATNIRTLRPLDDDDMWASLELSEKLNALQVIADSEVYQLGIGHELFVGADVLDEGTAAHYNERLCRITLDIDYLSWADPDEVLNTLCHEAFHAYEYRLAELYEVVPEEYRDLSAVQRYGRYHEEFLNYIDGDQSYTKYYTQAVEQDSRDHGEQAAKMYLMEINHLVRIYNLS